MSAGKSSKLRWLGQELAELERLDLRRSVRTAEGPRREVARLDGSTMVNFGSNDYLALAGDQALGVAAIEAAARCGWGSGASPLVCGHSQLHEQLSRRIARFEATEAALVFPSGFAANAGTIPALVERGDAVFADQLNHASLIDGCRLSRARVHVYPHADCAALERMLREAAGYRRRLIVTDSLFSMDGDLAPLPDLAALADRYDAMLMVDEAHATGVFGRQGRGACEHLGVEEAVDVRIGTLSKALGGSGGFVAGPQALIDWLMNRARPYVFSTAPPAALCAAAIAALDSVSRHPERGAELLARAEVLRERLREQGWDVGRSASQIIPLIVGEPQAALRQSAALAEQGLFVPAIRPPSVPAGQSRLRISLSWGHEPAMLERLQDGLGVAGGGSLGGRGS